jgi:hypothetical protein
MADAERIAWTMRIIAKGPAFLKEWRLEDKCKHCHTEVELGTEDVKATWSDGDWYNSGSTSLTWKCPLCDTHNWLTGEKRKSYLEGHPKVKR